MVERVLVVEHKTAGEDISPAADYWRRLRMDAQVSAYFAGARALGYDPAACLYDVLAKPAQRPLLATPPATRKVTKDGRLYAGQRDRDETPDEYEDRIVCAIAEDPDRYYVRGEVVRLEADEREHAFDAWQLGRQIREAELAGRYPRNPDACVRYGRACEYFGVCCGEASIDDPLLFRRTPTNPELSEGGRP